MKQKTGDSPEVCLSSCELAASLRSPRVESEANHPAPKNLPMKSKIINMNSAAPVKVKAGKQFEILVNATALSGEDWEMIAPYGDFPSADRKRTQRFNRKQAEAMVADFNSVWSKMGKMFRGVPIFHGHPDVDPANWPDDRRLGKITALEARQDGLYGKPEYNALGNENKAEGWWVYPSPTWLSPRTSSNIVEPDELMSIGLVNRPNIFESQPWTNSNEVNAEILKAEKLKEETEETNETDTIITKGASLCDTCVILCDSAGAPPPCLRMVKHSSYRLQFWGLAGDSEVAEIVGN